MAPPAVDTTSPCAPPPPPPPEAGAATSWPFPPAPPGAVPPVPPAPPKPPLPVPPFPPVVPAPPPPPPVLPRPSCPTPPGLPMELVPPTPPLSPPRPPFAKAGAAPARRIGVRQVVASSTAARRPAIFERSILRFIVSPVRPARFFLARQITGVCVPAEVKEKSKIEAPRGLTEFAVRKTPAVVLRQCCRATRSPEFRRPQPVERQQRPSPSLPLTCRLQAISLIMKSSAARPQPICRFVAAAIGPARLQNYARGRIDGASVLPAHAQADVERVVVGAGGDLAVVAQVDLRRRGDGGGGLQADHRGVA